MKIEIKRMVAQIDRDFEKIRDSIISELGADPGHEIGDAGNGFDLLTNVATEIEKEDIEEYISAISKVLETPKNLIRMVLHELLIMTPEDHQKLAIEIYPDETGYQTKRINN